MHRYSLDKENYERIWYIIILISTVFDVIINAIIIPKLQCLFSNQIIFILFSIFITTLVSFYGFYYLFNNYLWKCRLINKKIGCPNISGNWKGKITNSKHSIQTEVEIRQTWTEIVMNLKTATASSKTTALSFFTEDSKNPEIIYIYENKVRNTNKFHSHGGTGKLTFFKEEDKLIGNYYTDEQRETHGKIELKKIK